MDQIRKFNLVIFACLNRDMDDGNVLKSAAADYEIKSNRWQNCPRWNIEIDKIIIGQLA